MSKEWRISIIKKCKDMLMYRRSAACLRRLRVSCTYVGAKYREWWWLNAKSFGTRIDSQLIIAVYSSFLRCSITTSAVCRPSSLSCTCPSLKITRVGRIEISKRVPSFGNLSIVLIIEMRGVQYVRMELIPLKQGTGVKLTCIHRKHFHIASSCCLCRNSGHFLLHQSTGTT